MKTYHSCILFAILTCITYSGMGQSGVVRFEHRTSNVLSYDMTDFLSEESNNQLIWSDGWHNGLELNDFPESSSVDNIYLLPDNEGLASIDEEDEYYMKLKKLNKSLKTNKGLNLLTWPGCAGLDKVKLNENITLVYVDTEWFFHPNARGEFSNTKCKTLWEIDFWASLEDIIENESDKLVCIVGHHSILQESKNNQSVPFLYPFNGPINDYNSAAYMLLRTHMVKLLEANDNVIYISSNSSKKENKFPKKEIFLKDHSHIDLITEKDGTVNMIGENDGVTKLFKGNKSINANDDTQVHFSHQKNGKTDSTTVTGAEYKASGMKAFWLGKNFRNEWTTPVSLNKLYVDDISGGLYPYATGGGLQTLSLKFKDKDGRKYSFRSVNKDAKKNKEKIVMQTVVGEIKQDMISSQLPFGDVVVGKLLDHTNILHVDPVAYIMASQDALGEYNEDFKYVIGTLEEKPTNNKKNREGFDNADEIVTTHDVFKHVMNNNVKNQIDKELFTRCIMFDIWIADWDRHHDNWKWAVYNDGKKRLYKPIPRDRDHAFALFEGLIGNVSDMAAPNLAELSPEIRDIQGMTFQGKSLIYFFGSTITREEWNNAAEYISSTFNKENIEDAWSVLPVEIQEFSKEKIISRLISRIDDLPRASNQLYDLYHKKAIFYGSNKEDELTINAISKDEVIVTLYNPKSGGKEIISQKTFNADVTKQLEIYTLDGEDVVSIEGESDINFDIILVPGTDKDEVKGQKGNKKIKIYDTQKFDQPKSIELEKPIYPDIYGFQYDALLPYAMYQFDTDYKSGFEIKFTKRKQKFNKKLFGRSTSLAAKYYPSGNSLRLRLVDIYKDVWKKWDSEIKVRAANNDTRFDRFLGFDSELPVDYLSNFRQGDDYYVQNDNVDIYLGLVNNVYGQSDFSIGVGSQYINFEDGTGDSAQELLGDRDIWQTYVEGEMNLDFTDHRSYPTKGMRYNATNRLGYNIRANEGFYNTFTADFTHVNSWHDITKSILIIKAGGAFIVGDKSYIDFPTLGNTNNVRGFTNNLIRNSETAFVNVELRKEIYKSNNRYLPYLLGVSGFYDRGFALGNSFNNLSGYGGGLYMTFFNNAYSVYVYKGYNSFDDTTILTYGLGFSI